MTAIERWAFLIVAGVLIAALWIGGSRHREITQRLERVEIVHAEELVDRLEQEIARLKKELGR